ncbi:hypothetical protein JTB14_030495 [Gonioctena quinquepunctata]|nr:hypothetical protein JTB14_030495 [Gonioctena quinquepunctata]
MPKLSVPSEILGNPRTVIYRLLSLRIVSTPASAGMASHANQHGGGGVETRYYASCMTRANFDTQNKAHINFTFPCREASSRFFGRKKDNEKNSIRRSHFRIVIHFPHLLR